MATESKRLTISTALRHGDRAARAGEPLWMNPHVGSLAQQWRTKWIIAHRTQCQAGCPWCAVLDTPPHLR